MDVKVLRIKQVGMGFSVLVSSDGEEKGFTFPLGEGWKELVNGEPKYVGNIREQLKKQAEVKATAVQEFSDLKNSEGKVFKEKKTKAKG